MKAHLHPGAKWILRLNAYRTIFMLGIFIFLFISFRNITEFNVYDLMINVIIIIGILIIVGEIYAQMAYTRWFYEFTTTNLKIEKGIIWKRYSNIPYERVQNVDILRGILARMFGFSAVNIQTAGYSSMGYSRGGIASASEGYIPAVDMQEAEKIREFLMKKISKRSRSGL